MVFSLTSLSRLVPRLKLDHTIDVPHVEITPNHNNQNELQSGTSVITTTTAARFETRPPGIYIVRTSSLIHLIRPPGNDPGQDEEPREDAVLTGYVAVRTERPCRAKELRVEFIGEARLTLPGRPVKDTIIHHAELSIANSSSDSELDSSENTSGSERGIYLDSTPRFFEFAFVIPSTLAPFFRTDRGRVAHRVEATLRGIEPGNAVGGHAGEAGSVPSGSTCSNSISSTQEPDAPWLQEDLKAFKEVWIFAVPTADLQPLPLDHTSSHFIPGLGILGWTLRSSSCTVAGLVLLSLGLTSPDPLSTLWMIKMTICQSVTMTPPASSSGPYEWPATETLVWARGRLPETQREYVFSESERDIPIWQGDETPGPAHKKGIGLVETRQAVRLPNSSRLRPTTLQGTITPIMVKHTLRLTAYYSVWGQDAKGQPLSTGRCGTMRQVQVSHPLTILPCCCTKKDLVLPTYEPSQAERKAPLDDRDCSHCVCEESMEDLLKAETLAGNFLDESDVAAPGCDGAASKNETAT